MNNQELLELNDSIIFGSTPVHKKIYVDLQFFKDIFLGVIALNINTEDDYNNLLEDLKHNDYRIIENPTILFPKFKFGYLAYRDFIENKDNHNNIFKASPFTDFFDIFTQYLHTAIQRNKVAYDRIDSLPTVYVNVGILKISTVLKKIFKDFLITKFGLKVILIDEDILSLKEKMFYYDSFFIYDFKSFIENSFYKTAFQELAFLKKTIVAPKIIYSHQNLIGLDTDPVLLKTHKGILNDFELVEKYINILTDFNFLDPFTLKPS